MYSAALATLAAGATVVTPTRRLASAIRRAYDAQQHAAGVLHVDRHFETLTDVLAFDAVRAD